MPPPDRAPVSREAAEAPERRARQRRQENHSRGEGPRDGGRRQQRLIGTHEDYQDRF